MDGWMDGKITEHTHTDIHLHTSCSLTLTTAIVVPDQISDKTEGDGDTPNQIFQPCERFIQTITRLFANPPLLIIEKQFRQTELEWYLIKKLTRDLTVKPGDLHKDCV